MIILCDLGKIENNGRSSARSEGVKGKFLSKLKKSIVGEDEDGFGAALEDEDMDLESGVIRIDDSDPDEVITGPRNRAFFRISPSPAPRTPAG